MNPTNKPLTPPIQVEFQENVPVEKPSLFGKKTKNRIKFQGMGPWQEYWVAVASNLIKQTNPPSLNFFERIRFVLLHIKDGNGNEGYVKVNANSLKKKFYIDGEILQEAAKKNQGDVTALFSVQLHKVVCFMAEQHELEANIFLARKFLQEKNSERQAFHYYTKTLECVENLDQTQKELIKEAQAHVIDEAQAHVKKFGEVLGDKYKYVHQNDDEAMKYYGAAASRGNEQALEKLLHYYINEHGEKARPRDAFQWYQLGATQKHPAAINRLGWCYAHGIGTPANPKKAYEYYKKAADAGHVGAMNNLGWCYEKGIGIEPNPNQAFKWYKKGADAKDTIAMNNLGRCYEYGIGTEIILEQAFDCYTISANAGNTHALNSLGHFYERSAQIMSEKEESKKSKADQFEKLKIYDNLSKAFDYYKRGAEAGHPLAMYNLAQCFEQGIGTAKSSKDAIHWYQESAKAGNVKAENALGLCYLREIPENNPSEAFACFEKATQAGNSEAMYNLAYCYLNGKGIARNFQKAFEYFEKADQAGNGPAAIALAWCIENIDQLSVTPQRTYEIYKKAADKGHAQSMYNLGRCHEHGIGTPPSPEDAFKWYQDGALYGNSKAMNALGLCHRNGIGTPVDPSKAFSWFFEASKKEDVMAMYHIGRCYRHGIGIEKNLEKAKQWHEKACNKADEKTRQAIEDLILKEEQTRLYIPK